VKVGKEESGGVGPARGEENESPEALISTREWSDIPYFRKPLFLIVSFLLFMPVYLMIIWTGDTYVRKNGIVYKTSKKIKIRMTFVAVSLMLTYFIRQSTR
jgi:hypothetical protein